MFEHLIKCSKGRVTTTHAAGTASTTTSSAVDCQMHNALLVKFDISGSGAWTIKLQGALESTGTFVDLYDNNGNLMSTGSISASRCQLFVGIPDFIKVVATEDTNGATVTVKTLPITV